MTGIKKASAALLREIKAECSPAKLLCCSSNLEAWSWFRCFVFLPYLPCLHTPGWLTNLAFGLSNDPSLAFSQAVLADVIAGLTVAALLIPQALAYASLAHLPPIAGLHSVVLAIAGYAVLGVSMQSAMGPTAVTSLLTASLLARYQVEFFSQEASDLAAQAALVVGLLLGAMSVLNLGPIIYLISTPVLSAHTSAAALLIALTQIKAAFGFSGYFPMAGDGRVEYNYQEWQWVGLHFYDTRLVLGVAVPVVNPYAVSICFSLFAPLLIIQWLKRAWPPRPPQSRLHCLLTLAANGSSFLAVALGAVWARAVRLSVPAGLARVFEGLRGENGVAAGAGAGGEDPTATLASLGIEAASVADLYHRWSLSTVGHVPSGLAGVVRVPPCQWPLGPLLLAVLPLAFLVFVEHYAITRRIASVTKRIRFINISQELFAVAASNALSGLSGGLPITSSYSRSNLSYNAGATSPLAAVVCLSVILLALSVQTLTVAMFWIPYAALAAVILASVSGLVIVSDFWNAWKWGKGDCFTMAVSFLVTFILSLEWGLLAGVCSSVLVLLFGVVCGGYTEVEKGPGKGVSEGGLVDRGAGRGDREGLLEAGLEAGGDGSEDGSEDESVSGSVDLSPHEGVGLSVNVGAVVGSGASVGVVAEAGAGADGPAEGRTVLLRVGYPLVYLTANRFKDMVLLNAMRGPEHGGAALVSCGACGACCSAGGGGGARGAADAGLGDGAGVGAERGREGVSSRSGPNSVSGSGGAGASVPGSSRDRSCMGSCSGSCIGSPGQGDCSLPWRRAAAGRIQAVLASIFLPPPDPLSVRAALRDGARGRLLDRSVRGSIINSHTSSDNRSEGVSGISSHISSLSASSRGSDSTCSTVPKHHSERTYSPTQPPDIEGANDADGENRGAAALGMWMSGPSLPPPRPYHCDAPSDPCADVATAATAASAGDGAAAGAAAGLADGDASAGDGVVTGVGVCKCIVLDFSAVTLLDLTGMEALREALHEVREGGGAAAVVHLHPALACRLARFGLRNDALPGARAGVGAGVVGGRDSGVWAAAGWGEGLPLRARGARRVLGSLLVLPEPLLESGLEEEKEDEEEEVGRGDGDSYNRI